MNGFSPRRVVPIVTVGALLAAAAIAASVATPGVHSVPIPREAVSRAIASQRSELAKAGVSPPPPGPGAQPPFHLPHWLQLLTAVLCAVASLALVVFLIWRVIRLALETRANRVEPAGPVGAAMATRREVVLAAVDAGIAELASPDGDARAAVIACWVRLEEVAAAAGTRREAGDTPAELVTRLLNAHQVSPGVLNTLARLYRAARYGTHEIGSSVRDQARRALGQLRDELARSRSGPLENDEPIPVPRPAVPDGGAR